MNRRGVYSPEDTTEGEGQKMSGGSTHERGDTSRDVHGSCGGHSSSEVSVESKVELYAASVKEGADPLDCNANISEPQKKDVTGGSSDVVEEEKTHQNRKRLKLTHPSDQRTYDPDITKEESLTPFCYQTISGKGVTAEDRVSVEVVDTKPMTEKSNENEGHNCDAIVLKEAPTEMETNEFPRVDSGDACNNDVPLLLNAKEICFPESSDGSTILANNLQEEVHDEATENISNVDLQEESICNFPRGDSGKPKEDSVASDTDISLRDVRYQVLYESTNVAIERAFAAYTKKLLVLDVNGLLADICPYVPSDFKPDAIIMNKAVFKRPYCDDFFKFCFEKFDVGVWTSRTKWNIAPIIDFLLGNDKSKLLFCWDQSHCTDTGFYTLDKRDKPLLLKKIKKLWDKCEADLPWEKGAYNETNTLLIDDTPSKALCNPRYNAVFPLSYRFKSMGDKSLGPNGDLRHYLEGLATAQNIQEYVKQNPFGQTAITKTNPAWRYYLRIIEADARRNRREINQ